MTKQEEIWEGIADILVKGGGCITADVTERITLYLHSKDVVIRVDKKINGNLVNELYDAVHVKERADCDLLVKQALNKAGLVATKPLIEEGV